MRKYKETTTTTLVEEALRKCDDFMDYRMLMDATGRNYNQVSAACHHLRNRQVIDVVVNPDGKGWWYALPKDGDTRTRVVEERTPEGKPRQRRRTKKVPSRPA